MSLLNDTSPGDNMNKRFSAESSYAVTPVYASIEGVFSPLVDKTINEVLSLSPSSPLKRKPI